MVQTGSFTAADIFLPQSGLSHPLQTTQPPSLSLLLMMEMAKKEKDDKDDKKWIPVIALAKEL